jgi:Na+-driven multidrug efflux pump
MSVYYFTRRSAQKFKGARFRVRRVGEVLAIGLPSLVQMGSLSVSIALINRVLGVVGGVSGVTAFAYMSRILTFAAVPFTAVTQALSPIAGYQYGAKRPDRLRDAVRYSVFLAAGYGLLAAALLIGFPAFFIGIFTDGAQTLQTGAQGLRILSAALIGMPLPLIAGAVFQATGAKANALLLYSASLLFLLPAAPLLSSIYGVSGVWWAYAAANAAASVLALLILLAAAKRLKKNGLALN